MDVIALTSQLADQLGVPNERGALVARMSRAGAAYQAGIRPGDVIIAFNGASVEDPGHFLRLLADAPIGKAARLTLLRAGRRVDVNVVVEQSQRRVRRG